MQKISAGIYTNTAFHGCNSSFIVTADGVVVIDTPMVPAEAQQWAKDIAKFGTVRYVINNEPHIDHISGNCWMGGTLIAHEGTRQAILEQKPDNLVQALNRLAPGSPPLDKTFRFRTPDITFTEQLTLYLGKHTIQLMKLPGHTPFQLAVYVPEEKVVFTSDNVVTAVPYFFQSVPDEWLKSLDKLQQLDIDKVVPGHGEVQDKRYLAQMKKNVQTWMNTVSAAVKKGLTLEEAQEKLTFMKEFPDLPRNDRTNLTIRNNIARLFDYFKTGK
jgi:cyclase